MFLIYQKHFFVKNHVMLNLYVWFQKLNINCYGFIKTEDLSYIFTKVQWRLLWFGRGMLIIINYSL